MGKKFNDKSPNSGSKNSHASHAHPKKETFVPVPSKSSSAARSAADYDDDDGAVGSGDDETAEVDLRAGYMQRRQECVIKLSMWEFGQVY